MSARAEGRIRRSTAGRSGKARPGGRFARSHNPVSRTSELARKRERRSFRFRLLAFTGLILALALVAGYQFWLRDSSLVSIKHLEIVGVDAKTEEGRQIDQAVRTAMGEMTTLNLKPGVLDQELSRFPRVADAAIASDFPDSAKVTVSLREDGSIYGEGSNALLVATDGTVLGPAAGEEDSLPLIGDGDPPATTGEASGPVATRGAPLTGRALAQALVLGAAPDPVRPYITGSHSTPEGVLVELEDGLVMLFGDPSHADQKWRSAVALIADPGFDTSSYVDLSVPRRPAISAEPPVLSTPDDGSSGVAGDSPEG